VRLSPAGAQLIASFEGFRSHPYRDAVGVWTIGYGSTRGVGESTPPVTPAQALARMMREVGATYGAAVDGLGLPLNQHQYDALVSFVYNVGPGGVAASTSVGRHLRARRWRDAADALLAWDKAGGRRLEGLTRRRRAERALFLSPVADALEGYTASERRWIREYDELKAADRNIGRRVVLRRVMTEQRKRIWRAAQPPGSWDHANRRARYRSLLARTR
jgi:GH24 family phage-related lysozyme (muramidase)